MQKEQAKKLKVNNGRLTTADDKPPWLKNTQRPGSESIHDHFLRYKEAIQSNTKSINSSKKSDNENKTITERPLTRGGFFDDVVTQLFEGNNNMEYDDLDLTGVKEVQDLDFDNNSNLRRNVCNKSFDDDYDDEDNDNDYDDDDIIDIKKPPNFIGSITTTEFMSQKPTNNKTKNIQKTTIGKAITTMQNNEFKKNFRNLQNKEIMENSMIDAGMVSQQTRIPPHLYQNTSLSSQECVRSLSPLPQRKIRPMDLFTRMSFGHDQSERDIIFQNSDEEDDYGDDD